MGKTWFSLNKNGEHCEMISAAECLIPIASIYHKDPYSSEYNSRFKMGSYLAYNRKFKTRVRTQFLSPKTVYAVNLVFKFMKKNPTGEPPYVALEYKLAENTKSSMVQLADEREDGWLMAKLYELTSDSRNVDLEIVFESSKQYYSSVLVVEGIEFRPLEKA
ncbi:putative phloem protein [Helianthus debilis subsp. tardiflorus]